MPPLFVYDCVLTRSSSFFFIHLLLPHTSLINHTITTINHSLNQVYDSYGQKCNHRFLLNYGFAIENNRESDGFCPNEVRWIVERLRWGYGGSSITG